MYAKRVSLDFSTPSQSANYSREVSGHSCGQYKFGSAHEQHDYTRGFTTFAREGDREGQRLSSRTAIRRWVQPETNLLVDRSTERNADTSVSPPIAAYVGNSIFVNAGSCRLCRCWRLFVRLQPKNFGSLQRLRNKPYICSPASAHSATHCIHNASNLGVQLYTATGNLPEITYNFDATLILRPYFHLIFHFAEVSLCFIIHASFKSLCTPQATTAGKTRLMHMHQPREFIRNTAPPVSCHEDCVNLTELLCITTCLSMTFRYWLKNHLQKLPNMYRDGEMAIYSVLQGSSKSRVRNNVEGTLLSYCLAGLMQSSLWIRQGPYATLAHTLMTFHCTSWQVQFSKRLNRQS